MPDVTGVERLSEEMALPTPNLPLLRKVLDHIDAHPEEWNQGDWATSAVDLARLNLPVPECGTAYCIAGHVVAMTEGFDKQGQPASGRLFGEVGQAELGLTFAESCELFSAYNVREDVQAAAEQIAARAGEVL